MPTKYSALRFLRVFLFGLSTFSRESPEEYIAKIAERRYYENLCKMGVLVAVKKNKVVAVVISVFDWYRTHYQCTHWLYCSADILLQHLTTQPKRRSYFESLILPF
jgi:hypothetical protein